MDWFFISLGLLFFFALSALVFLGWMMFRYATTNPRTDPLRVRPELSEQLRSSLDWFVAGRDRFYSLPHERLEMLKDGLKLSAEFLPANEHLRGTEFSGGLAVVVHGWCDQAESRMARAMDYYDAGFDVLVPDLRAHGRSEGRYVDMGCVHRDDILAWIEQLRGRLSPADKRFMVLDGLSMGASTVLSLSGDPLPDEMVAVIADCGYSSLKEQEEWICQKFPRFIRIPLLFFGNLFSSVLAKFNHQSPSACQQVAKAKVAVFIIHGEEDRYVPFFMGKELYDACASELKEYWPVAGAAHGMAEFVEGEEYKRRTLDFIRRARCRHFGGSLNDGGEIPRRFA